MKKLIAFAVVAALVASTQAASIQWKSGTLRTAKNADGEWSTTSIGNAAKATYLIVDQATYNTYANNSAKMYADWSTIASSAIRSSGEKTSSLGAINWTDNKGGASGGYTKDDGTIYLLALYTYTDATYGDFYIASSGSAAINDLGSAVGTTQNLASSVGAWTPVPEPTTVALLALGLVAAGLKRKVA